MLCNICNRKIVLIPSAEERAARDVTGKSAEYYRSLFKTHSECLIEKRNSDTIELIQKINNA